MRAVNQNLTAGTYEIQKTLYQGHGNHTYVASRISDGKFFFVKQSSKTEEYSPGLSKTAHEYKVLSMLDHPGIPKVEGILSDKNSIALIEEYIEGKSLKDWLHESALAEEKILRMAIQMTGILDHVHSKNVIHKNINPENIILSEEWNAHLVDFDISSDTRTQTWEMVSIDQIEGSLSYISPEQTGRTSHPVSATSDIYSLGMVLYESLAGKPPFDSVDPLEVVHFHLTRHPISLGSIIPELPSGLEVIITRMIDKDPEKRYQTAKGLRKDLEIVLDHHKNGKILEDFEPGRYDTQLTYKHRQKLYGREHEKNQLFNYYQNLEHKNSMLVIVSGYSGVGKSALINEVKLPISWNNGKFISGKFDQFKKDIPYYGFIEAIREFILNLFTEPEEIIAHWRNRINSALGKNAALITDVIPHLNKIIGTPPPVAKLQPAEQEARFHMVMLDFIFTFSSAENPLVIFLDDLQWADLSSLGLIRRIIENTRKDHILILGAYRDNEVDKSHPLMITLRQMVDFTDQIKTMHLDPLDFETTCLIVADSFDMSPSDAKKLGEKVYAKTKGNPFFIHNFLKSLYDDGYIKPDADNHWIWNPLEIDKLDYTDNVISLMTDRLNNLPEKTREVLKYAAVLGNTFYFTDLRNVMDLSGAQLSHYLMPAIEKSYLVSSDKDIRALALGEVDEAEDQNHYEQESAQFAFVHDRVQQASYGLITDEERARIHLHIGRLLISGRDESFSRESVFDLLNILKPGIHLMDDQEEKSRIARLCLLAGRKAKDSTAYSLGVRFLKMGQKLLPEDAWEIVYALNYNTLLELGECLYLHNDKDQAEEYFHEILAHARTNFDRLRVYYLHSSLYLKEGATSQSLKLGLEALKMYNIRFPKGKIALQVRTMVAIAKYLTLFSTRYRRTQSLMKISDCTDEEILAVNKLLIDVATSAYQQDKNLMMLVIFEIIKSYLKNGFTDASGFGFSGFSVVVLSTLKMQQRGFELWDTTMKMHEKTQSPIIRWRLRYTVLCFHHPWRLPFRESYDPLLETIKACVLNGDQIFTGYSVALYHRLRLSSGDNLGEVIKDADEHMDLIKNVKTGMLFMQPYYQLVHALMASEDGHQGYEDNFFNAENRMKWKQEENPTILGIYQSARTAYLYYSGQHELAVEESQQTIPYLENLVGDVIEMWHAFYTALSISACYSSWNLKKQRKYRKIFNRHLKALKFWTRGCPDNYLPHYFLIRAEACTMDGMSEEAFKFYEKAIEAAAQNKCRYVSAVAAECAGRYALGVAYHRVSDNYINKAWDEYDSWGAKIKCDQLKDEFHQILKAVDAGQGSDSPKVAALADSKNESLDLQSVMKASASIASQVKFNDLLKRMMHVIMENAGAESGVFLLLKENRIYLEAVGASGKEGVEILPSIPLENSVLVPESFIHYVWRTEEIQVVYNAVEDPRFELDSYVQNNKVASMMCLPVTAMGRVNSFIYLQNSQLKGAFDKSRVSLLEMLSGQIGISIENSLLYENLEEKVRERTREIERTLKELKTTQTQLVHSEKMASLGELTAGIAHEIQNPLNFVNNFSEVSKELIEELQEEKAKKPEERDPGLEEEILNDVILNLEKINHHGKRADAIVKGMLHHSRSGTGKKEPIDINALCDEYLRLAFHGLRAKDKSFNAKMDTEFENGLPKVWVIPQELGRVLLNLITNAFYAVNEKSKEGLEDYQPRVSLSTSLSPPPLAGVNGGGYEGDQRTGADHIFISVSDNGNGIPEEVRSKIFQPFFTTKPTGKGTGLGLSMSYDIVTKGHGGELQVDTVEGEGTTFVVVLSVDGR